MTRTSVSSLSAANKLVRIEWRQTFGHRHTCESTHHAPRISDPYIVVYCSKRWIVDREYIQKARTEDRHYVDDPDHLALLDIFFANRNVLTSLCLPPIAHQPGLAQFSLKLGPS